MLYLSVLLISIVSFSLVKNVLVITVLSTLPLMAAFVSSFFSLTSVNFLAELEFYVLAGLVIAQTLAYRYTVLRLISDSDTHTAAVRLLEQFKVSKPRLITGWIGLAFQIYTFAITITLLGTVISIACLILSIIFSGLQATLIPLVFALLVLSVISYFLGASTFNVWYRLNIDISHN